MFYAFDKVKTTEIAKLVVATSAFGPSNATLVDLEFRKCSGGLPAEIVDRRMDTLAKATDTDPKTISRSRLDYGTWDTLDIDLSVSDGVGFNTESINKLSKKMSQLTGFTLEYFVLRADKKRSKKTRNFGNNAILGLRFYNYSTVDENEKNRGEW